MVSWNEPGWTRRRRGGGFSYQDQNGRSLGPEDAIRCRALAIPPAWTAVWICPRPNGHLQAVGTDAAGRRQYLYHEEWRRLRDESKHDRVLKVAAKLPTARRAAAEDLQLAGMPPDRALAAAFSLLDLGLLRVGGESYAEENGSYGLATVRREHVTIRSGKIIFDFPAKSGQQFQVVIENDDIRPVIAHLLRRRDPNPELLAYKLRRRWHDLTSAEVNTYIKGVVGDEFTAKDFRTWHATVAAAVLFADVKERTRSFSGRKKAVSAVMRLVAERLGNTPAVARSSYVDLRLVDLFHDGVTIPPHRYTAALASPIDITARAGAERAVIKLLS